MRRGTRDGPTGQRKWSPGHISRSILRLQCCAGRPNIFLLSAAPACLERRNCRKVRNRSLFLSANEAAAAASSTCQHEPTYTRPARCRLAEVRPSPIWWDTPGKDPDDLAKAMMADAHLDDTLLQSRSCHTARQI